MKLINKIVIFIVGAGITTTSLFAQKKLVDDIYTYNYTKIINQNGGKAIAKKADYPHQRALAYSLAQVEQNALAFESYSELFAKYADMVDGYDKLCYALVARKMENYLLSDSFLLLLKNTEYASKPFYNELSQDFIDQNKASDNYWSENDFSTFYSLKPFTSNTKFGEYGLVSDKKGNAYYSTIAENALQNAISTWHEQPYFRIFKAKYGDSTLGIPSELTHNINGVHQHVSYVDVNSGFIYITRNAVKKNDKRERVLQVFALRQNAITKKWTEIPFQLNNIEFSVADLVISPDGSKVVFASDMPGGFGKSDLYEAPILKNDENGIKIGDAKNLGPNINTALRDNFPKFSDSGQFYFSSDGHLGFGGLDIFFVDGNTKMVLNAGRPINSSYDDFAPQIHDRDAWGTLSSNRLSKGYDDNLYFFRWVGPSEQEIEKSKESPVIVEVIDEETGLPVKGADVAIDDLNDSEIATKGLTDDKGAYSFFGIAPQDANPNLQVSSHPCGYRYATADSVVDLEDGSRKIVLKAKAYKVGDDVGKLFDIKPIHYASAKFDITDESKRDLDKLVVIMQDNPGLSVELGSHTDSKATAAFNQNLSESRAKAAYDYVVNRGVDASRIGYKGYGETNILNRCLDGVTCSDEEHAVNRRTEFIIRAIVPCTPVSNVVDTAKKVQNADISQKSMICGDADADGIPDYLDTDSDNDGIPDAAEGRTDTDKDGIPNFLDRDSDGDGIADGIEKTGDADKDGKANLIDTDSDGDGIDDKTEGTKDSDKDSQPDFLDTDSDNDGIPDKVEGSEDLDRDGLSNYLDLDADGDGISDSVEGRIDTDKDGKPNFLDTDSDGDTIPDSMEKGKVASAPADSDSDGKPDYVDTDSDNDGIPDIVEAPACLPGQQSNNTGGTNPISNVKTGNQTLTVSEPVVQRTANILTPIVTGTKVQYRIQFTISKTQIPVKTFTDKGLGSVYEYQQSGYYKYCTVKVFNSEMEALSEKARVRGLGYSDAFIAGFQNGVRVK
ncbi:MAG: OmpA family protein [Bacteroidetes bacterium]|nr:OmpA family protein [Bacteroidota bacterium]MDA1224331.1 OmpA family protein [Bacteroidota bacterium]